MYELCNLWLFRPVGKFRRGKYFKTSVICEGDRVKVRNGAIQYTREHDKPTHKVLGCYGDTLTGCLSLAEIMVLDLKTNDLSIINAIKEPEL